MIFRSSAWSPPPPYTRARVGRKRNPPDPLAARPRLPRAPRRARCDQTGEDAPSPRPLRGIVPALAALFALGASTPRAMLPGAEPFPAELAARLERAAANARDAPLNARFELSLVPRDGTGVVRGRGDRRAPEPALRRDPGRSRGASRRRGTAPRRPRRAYVPNRVL